MERLVGAGISCTCKIIDMIRAERLHVDSVLICSTTKAAALDVRR